MIGGEIITYPISDLVMEAEKGFVAGSRLIMCKCATTKQEKDVLTKGMLIE